MDQIDNPPTVIAGADALTHVIEAFIAKRRGEDPNLPQQHVFIGKTALTVHFALLAIRLLGRSLEKACADGAVADARGDVMMGALATGCAFGASFRQLSKQPHLPNVLRRAADFASRS